MKLIPQFGVLVLSLFSNLALALTFEEAVALAQNQVKEASSERSEYLKSRMGYENSIALDEQGFCYSIPGGGITQVIRINKEGVIDLVLSNIENPKSKCFRETYLDTKFSPPPFAPIYQEMLIGYGISPP